MKKSIKLVLVVAARVALPLMAAGMQEKKDEILGFYKEEYPDCYEVTEDEEEASWCCSCKSSTMFDELVLTEKEVE